MASMVRAKAATKLHTYAKSAWCLQTKTHPSRPMEAAARHSEMRSTKSIVGISTDERRISQASPGSAPRSHIDFISANPCSMIPTMASLARPPSRRWIA